MMITQIIELYLMFLQHVIQLLNLSINELENTEATAVDIFNIIADLRNKSRSQYAEELFQVSSSTTIENKGIDEAQKRVNSLNLFLLLPPLI